MYYNINFARNYYPRVVSYNFGKRNTPTVQRLMVDYPNIVAEINSKVNANDPYTREDLAEYKRIKSDPDYKAYLAEERERLAPINRAEMLLDEGNTILNDLDNLIAQGDTSKSTLDLRDRVIRDYDRAQSLQDTLNRELAEWGAPYKKKYDEPLAKISYKRQNLNQALDRVADVYKDYVNNRDISANTGERRGMIVGGLAGTGLGAGVGAYLAARNGVKGTRGRRAARGALIGAGVGALGGTLAGRFIGKKLGLKKVRDFDPMQYV